METASPGKGRKRRAAGAEGQADGGRAGPTKKRVSRRILQDSGDHSATGEQPSPQVLPLSLPPTNSSLKADCIIVWPQGTEEKTTDDVHSENTDVPERFVFVHIHTQIEQNYCFMGNRRGRGARGGRRRKREEEEEEEEKEEERDTADEDACANGVDSSISESVGQSTASLSGRPTLSLCVKKMEMTESSPAVPKKAKVAEEAAAEDVAKPAPVSFVHTHTHTHTCILTHNMHVESLRRACLRVVFTATRATFQGKCKQKCRLYSKLSVPGIPSLTLAPACTHTHPDKA